MHMMFSDLVSAIKEQFSPVFVCIGRDVPVTDLMLLDASAKGYRNSEVYFGHGAQVDALQPPHNLVVTEGGAEKSLQTVPNVVVVGRQDSSAVFNLLQRTMTASLRAETSYARMLRMILNGKELASVLSEAARQLGNPLVAMDVSGKILARSTPFNVSDPLWITSAERGYCPVDFMEHIKSVRLGNKRRNTSEAFASVCASNGLTYICSRILLQEELVGYVFLFTDGTASRDSYEILPMISRVTGELIRHYNVDIGLKTGLYRSVLADLLAGVEPEHAKARIAAGDLTFPKQMRVAVVRPTYYRGESFLRGLQGELQQLFGGAPSVYYQGGIAQIVPLNDLMEFHPNCTDAFCAMLEAQHLIGGVSNEFSRPDQFAQYYTQADEALRIARRLQRPGLLHHYADLAFYSLLNQLPLDLRIGRFCHPALARLRQYDAGHGTELYETLRVYTELGFSQKLTAERLFLHRNTLNYRMQRVAEVGGLDLGAPETLFLLMYSFQIDSYIQHKPA